MITKLKNITQNVPKKTRIVILIFIIIVIFSLPTLLFNQRYLLFVLCVSGIYLIVNSGLDLCFGYSGQISIGQAGFYALGAYSSAILSLRFGLPVPLTILLGSIIAGIIGYFLAFSAVKLVHHFLALVTIGFGEIVRLIFLNGGKFTGGPDGIIGIPPFKIFGITFGSSQMFFYVIWFSVIIFLLLKTNIVNSRIGRVFIAIRENPTASESFGIKLSKYKAMAFAIGALFAGFAGGLYAHLVKFISPESFSINQSVMFLVMILIGGSGTFFGPILGGILIIVVNENLQIFGDYQMAIYGILIILVLFFLPKGIIGTLKEKPFFAKSASRKEVKK